MAVQLRRRLLTVEAYHHLIQAGMFDEDDRLELIEGEIILSERSEPQPDLALLRPRADYYAGSHPSPEAILLVVEASETSASYDRDVKMPLYARAGIPEAWLVSLVDKWVEVYREPSPVGYLSMRRILPGASVAPQVFSDDALAVSEMVE